MSKIDQRASECMEAIELECTEPLSSYQKRKVYQSVHYALAQVYEVGQEEGVNQMLNGEMFKNGKVT